MATTKPSDIYANMKALYSPKGSFMSGIQAQLDRLGKKANAQGMSNLVGSGLAGTSMAGNLSTAFAEDVAAPQLAQAESQRIGSLAGIMGQEAGYWAGINARNADYQHQLNMRPSPTSNMPSMFAPTQRSSSAPAANTRSGPATASDGELRRAAAARAASLPSVNVGEVSDSIMPASLRGAVQSEPNWVITNGRRFVENAAGQYLNDAGQTANAWLRSQPQRFR